MFAVDECSFGSSRSQLCWTTSTVEHRSVSSCSSFSSTYSSTRGHAFVIAHVADSSSHRRSRTERWKWIRRGLRKQSLLRWRWWTTSIGECQINDQFQGWTIFDSRRWCRTLMNVKRDIWSLSNANSFVRLNSAFNCILVHWNIISSRRTNTLNSFRTSKKYVENRIEHECQCLK